MRLDRFREYRALAERGHAVPISVELSGDLDTPVSVFLKLGAPQRGFILESCEGGERFGRYSFVGGEPAGTVRLESDGALVTTPNGSTRRKGAPLDVLRALWRERAVTTLADEAPFVGGLVGYIGYGAARWFEPRVPDRHRDDTQFPDSEWLLCEEFVTLDTRTQSLRATAIARPALSATATDAVRDAEARAHLLAEQIRRPLADVPSTLSNTTRATRGKLSSTGWERGSFESAVERVREYIRAGDCMQVVLARRFEHGPAPPRLALYRALRRINPSPYLFLLGLGETRALVGSSPELLVRVRGGEVVVRPIAGTRPRGIDEAQDLALERELLADEKERAEHVMLVDLGRNDIGRVAAKGTVRVESYMTIERYSHVMHMVSEVHGRLAPERDALDALASCFPAGTLSGAPKIRAMEIIDELEPMRRGPYGGGVGYLSYGGTMDTAIAIRTFHIDGDRALWTAGAGIVTDSDPAREADETEHKAGALAAAIADVEATAAP